MGLKFRNAASAVSCATRESSRKQRSQRSSSATSALSQTAGQPCPIAASSFGASATASKQMDPRDALGDLLVDAVVPVLGWPAFYKCAALSRAWRATLDSVGKDLRRRHAPPPPRFGLALLDLPLFVDRVVPFLGGRPGLFWAGLFRLCPVSRGWNAAVAGRARAGPSGGCSTRRRRRSARTRRTSSAGNGTCGGAASPTTGSATTTAFRGETAGECLLRPARRRAAVSRTGAARRLRGRITVKDGYASTAANTFQPLDRWRLVSSVAADPAIQKDVGDDFFEDFPRLCLIVLRCWRVPMCGECYDIWQMVYLSLFDGLLYYHNSRATRQGASARPSTTSGAAGSTRGARNRTATITCPVRR